MSQERQEGATDRAERLLINRILDNTYPPGSDLPGERTLSKELGVARPALREALQRLSRDGWLEIQQGKPTRVRDYIHSGNLTILVGLLKADHSLVPNLVPDLLKIWEQLGPGYTADAIRRAPGLIIDLLDSFANVADEPEAYTQAMWRLLAALVDYCGSLAYSLIFKTFADYYHRLAIYYYAAPERRGEARHFWQALRTAAESIDAEGAASLMRDFIRHTRDFWQAGAIEEFRQQGHNSGQEAEG